MSTFPAAKDLSKTTSVFPIAKDKARKVKPTPASGASTIPGPATTTFPTKESLPLYNTNAAMQTQGFDNAPGALKPPASLQNTFTGNATDSSGNPVYIGNKDLNPDYTPQTSTVSPASSGPAASITSDTSTGTSTTSGPIMPASGSIVDLLNQQGEPSSFDARQQMAKQYGVAGYKGTAAQNQQLAQKYIQAHQTAKTQPAPQSGAEGRDGVQTTLKNQSDLPDPQQTFFDTYASMNPIVKSMYDMISTVLSPQHTTQTFTDEYNKLIQSQGIPGLQTDLINVQNVMRGTEDDIRTEVSKSGGFATESQVQAMAATRNKVLLKQATALSATLQQKEDYVNQIMNFSKADRQQVNDDIDRKIGLTEKMATIQDTMNKGATTGYQKIIDNIGYTGLAKTFAGNPQAASNAEKLLYLPSGSLTDPVKLSEMETNRQKQIALNAARTQVIVQSAQGGGGGGGDALRGMLDVYNTTGQIPSFGYGAAGQAMRKQFYAAISGEGTAGIASAASNKASLAGSTSAMRNQEVQYNAAKTSLGTLEKQLDLLSTYSDKVDRGGSPVLNKYILWTKGQIQGDADTQALQNIVQTASNEFAKILSGASASIAGTTVSSAEDAKKLLNASMTPTQIKTLIGLMKKEGNFRLSSQEETIKQIKSDIGSLGQSDQGQIITYKGKRFQADANGNFDPNSPL